MNQGHSIQVLCKTTNVDDDILKTSLNKRRYGHGLEAFSLEILLSYDIYAKLQYVC